MKTVKIKSTENGCTLAPNYAPVGKQASGAINYAIVNVPDDAKIEDVVRLAGLSGVWFGLGEVFDIPFAMLGAGAIITKQKVEDFNLQNKL